MRLDLSRQVDATEITFQPHLLSPDSLPIKILGNALPDRGRQRTKGKALPGIMQ
jgi:hypothetical protein